MEVPGRPEGERMRSYFGCVAYTENPFLMLDAKGFSRRDWQERVTMDRNREQA